MISYDTCYAYVRRCSCRATRSMDHGASSMDHQRPWQISFFEHSLNTFYGSWRMFYGSTECMLCSVDFQSVCKTSNNTCSNLHYSGEFAAASFNHPLLSLMQQSIKVFNARPFFSRK